MEIKDLINLAQNGKITAFIGKVSVGVNKILPAFDDFSGSVGEYFSKICDNEKLLKAFSTMDIKKNIINSKMTILSNSLKNKLAIIEALVSNDDILIFNNIQKSLSYREIQNVKRILKKLAEYNKKVIVLTDDIEFLFGLTKNVIIVSENEYNDLTPVNWFDSKIYKYVSKPPIIDFVINCKRRGIKIDDSYETKELLKAIYRSVDK